MQRYFFFALYKIKSLYNGIIVRISYYSATICADILDDRFTEVCVNLLRTPICRFTEAADRQFSDKHVLIHYLYLSYT